MRFRLPRPRRCWDRAFGPPSQRLPTPSAAGEKVRCPWSLGEPVAGVLSTSAAGEVDTPRFDCTWKPPVDLQDAAATEVIAWADLRVASQAPPTL